MNITGVVVSDQLVVVRHNVIYPGYPAPQPSAYNVSSITFLVSVCGKVRACACVCVAGSRGTWQSAWANACQ